MKRAHSWGIVRSNLTWMVLILLAVSPAIANPPSPLDLPISVEDTASQSTRSGSEAEAPPPAIDPANQNTLPGTENEALPQVSDPADQSPPQGSDAEVPPSAKDPTDQNLTPDPAIEAPTPAGDSPQKGKKSVLKVILQNAEMDFTLTSGLRKDDFQWSIAGNIAGTNPNILSELTWSDVDSYQLALTNRTIIKRILYIHGELSYAFIQNGRVQDSDFRLDNRGDEYSRSISNSSGDQIWDISLAAGYPFFFLKDRLMVAPLLGYAHHSQNFRITDGEQVITDPSPRVPDLGPLPGLNSTYRSNWQGPWIGCDLRYRLPDQGTDKRLPMELGFSVGFHFADYEADANWNLRDDLEHPLSFAHNAEGLGVALAGEWLVGLAENWDFVFRATYQHWKTDPGVDFIYKDLDPNEQTRLNEVEWSNYSVLVGANFHF